MTIDYNGALTREKFLFHEIRIVASLIQEGLSREEIYQKVEEENLFQFPTEKLIKRTVGTCFQRIDALDSEILVYHLATAPMTVAKQINLYSMMKQYRLVWDFKKRLERFLLSFAGAERSHSLLDGYDDQQAQTGFNQVFGGVRLSGFTRFNTIELHHHRPRIRGRDQRTP